MSAARVVTVPSPATAAGGRVRARRGPPRAARTVVRARAGAGADSVVRAFFAAFNERDVDAAVALLDEDVVYEDLIYADPFRGRAAVASHLEETMRVLPPGMAFVLVDTSPSADGTRCGSLWKVTLDGIDFPFGRGTSFHRIDPASGRMVYAVDVPEPAPTKPGGSALSAISAIAALVRVTGYTKSQGPLWEPQQLEEARATGGDGSGGQRQASLTSRVGWAVFFLAYTYMVLFDPDTPGDPAYATSPETLHALIDQSLQFFFVVPALALAGVDSTGILGPVAAAHLAPEALALFNFSNAYSLLFAGIVFSDRRNVGRRWLWAGQMFLTNLFFIPYLATRSPGEGEGEGEGNGTSSSSGSGTAEGESFLERALTSPALGVLGGLVGAASIGWLFFAYPSEFGDPEGRPSRLLAYISSDRPAFAFCVDLILYACFQAYLLWDPVAQGIGRRSSARDSNPLRLVPFFGLAWYLAASPPSPAERGTPRPSGD